MELITSLLAGDAARIVGLALALAVGGALASPRRRARSAKPNRM